MVRLVHMSSYIEERPGIAEDLTWQLLQERDSSINISHQETTREEHEAFIASHPYWIWSVIENEIGEPIGAAYITLQNEIGIGILKEHQGKGYGPEAIQTMLQRYTPLPAKPSYRPGYFVANINPENARSISMFKGLGATHISNTYRL